MDKLLNWLKIATSLLCTSVVCLLGGWDIFLKTLLLFSVIDVITGILASLYLKQTDSNITYKGFIRKLGIYIIIVICVQLDTFSGTQNLFRTLAIGYYIGYEGISITENWGKMELPLPKKLKDALAQLHKEK